MDSLGAAQAKVRSETHFSFPESFRFPLGNLFLLAPNTICKKYKLPFYFQMNSYKVIIIFAIFKPLHPKLAHAFGYRLSLRASVHSQTWPVIVTVTKRALLSSSLPVPRITADENSSHNHFIMEDRGGLRLCGAPGWNLERGPFYNREKNKWTNWSICINETRKAWAKKGIVN